MTCPYLSYRRSDGEGLDFDHERAYCSVQEEFVSPVKADICNDRGRFDHASHCEVYARHEAEAENEADPEVEAVVEQELPREDELGTENVP